MTGALIGGVAGAVVAALVLGGLWWSGVLPGGTSGSSVTQAQLPEKVTAQITALEKQVSDLQQRPSSAAAPAADPALLKRVTDAENAMKSLGVALTALNRRSDDIAAKAAQASEQAAAAEKAVTELRASLQDVSKTAKAGASSVALESLQKRIAATRAIGQDDERRNRQGRGGGVGARHGGAAGLERGGLA